uniref:Uncharacterized protein n=1 Tax=Triticum urartu TaxID=4572 RepID=A0A8R7U2E0_TRIUA
MAILSCNFVMSGFSHIFCDYFLRILISILLEYVGILRQEERSGRAYHGKLQQICSSHRCKSVYHHNSKFKNIVLLNTPDRFSGLWFIRIIIRDSHQNCLCM